MGASAGQEPTFDALIAELVAFRLDCLQGRPSDRVLAEAADVSPTTIGNWLRKGQFPQVIDPLLALVRAVQVQAESAGLASEPTAVTLLDVQRWRRAHQAEARRRADTTRSAVEAGQGRAVLERMRPGRPLAEVTDPFQLEVHHAIDSPVVGLPVLPAYVPREHDRALAEVVAGTVAGDSRIAVLVGGSSTGKTRACWEALKPLRERDEPWRLWHPIDPSRPGAALAGLADLAPYTVIWLNEAQFYLASDQFGEQVAAGLRTLLHDTARAPVLVLATLWPEYWNTLTTRTSPDGHAQARELLDGHKIKVPDAFTGDDLAALAGNAGRDPRLGEAAEHAADGHITQYLAGGPVLLDRYQDAPPATRALIDAAMDARRLGAGARIPLAWLADAAPGYLTDTEWDHTGEDWLKQALDYVTTPCNGIPGILTPVKTGAPRNQRNRRTTAGRAGGHPTPSGPGPLYRLADYLDQHGRHHRADHIPPIDFWTAAATHAHPGDLHTLGDAAWDRGLYRDAAQLLKHATIHGNLYAAEALVARLHSLHPTDHRPAQHVTAHSPFNDPHGVNRLMNGLLEAETQKQSAALLARSLATDIPLDNPDAVYWPLSALRKTGAREQFMALAERAATHAPLDDPDGVAHVLNGLRAAGAQEHVAALLARNPATHSPLDEPDAVIWLLDSLWEAGAHEQFISLAERAATHIPLDEPRSVFGLLMALLKAEAHEQVATLLARNPATHVQLHDPPNVCGLLIGLGKAGSQEQVRALAQRFTADTSFDKPNYGSWLLHWLRKAGAHEEVTALAQRFTARISLDDPAGVIRLLDELVAAGVHEEATALAERAAAHMPLDEPARVGLLLDRLRAAGAHEQVATLLARNPAAHVALGDPYHVGWLLHRLRKAGAHEQVATLLARNPATHFPLDDPRAVGSLLNRLRDSGAHEQVATLLARNPAAHVPLGDLRAVGWSLNSLWEAGAHEQATALAERAAAHVPLGDPDGVGLLLNSLREVGAHEQATALAQRAVAHIPLDKPNAVAHLLTGLREAGTHEHVAALLARNPAIYAALDVPDAVAKLLNGLWEAGARDQVRVLAQRAAAHAPLDGRLDNLLEAMRRAGADEQVTVLAKRLPAARRFHMFMGIDDHQNRFRFGREPDGSAAAPWTWEDLE
ncbi:hypothetical protein [Streptomyces sp. NPDC002676]